MNLVDDDDVDTSSVAKTDLRTNNGHWWSRLGPLFFPPETCNRLWFDTNCFSCFNTWLKSVTCLICLTQKPYNCWQLRCTVRFGSWSFVATIPPARCFQSLLNCLTNPGLTSAFATKSSRIAQNSSPSPHGPICALLPAGTGNGTSCWIFDLSLSISCSNRDEASWVDGITAGTIDWLHLKERFKCFALSPQSFLRFTPSSDWSFQLRVHSSLTRNLHWLSVSPGNGSLASMAVFQKSE